MARHRKHSHSYITQEILDALGPRRETFIYKMYLEEKKHVNCLEIFLVLKSKPFARDEAHNKQNHWHKQNQTGPRQGRVSHFERAMRVITPLNLTQLSSSGVWA